MQPITKFIDQKAFNKLTRAQKRVAICQDVIERIEAENFEEHEGQIIQGEVLWDKSVPLKEAINENKCEVCARGAILCSWIGNFNRVKWDEIQSMFSTASTGIEETYTSKNFPPQILKVFGQRMLDRIEAAFENSTFPWHYNRKETAEYAEAFKKQSEDEDGDMVWRGTSIVDLMKYITDNNGEFPLPKNK